MTWSIWRSSCSPDLYRAQVALFRRMAAAGDDPRFLPLRRHLGDQWGAAWDYVAADMNGAAVFLLATLRMKTRHAIRLRVGVTHADWRFFRVWTRLLEMMGFRADALDAARHVTTNRSRPAEAKCVEAFLTSDDPSKGLNIG